MNSTAPSAMLWFVAGFGIWGLCFALLYAAQATGCEWGWHEVPVGPVTLQRLLLGAILLAHAAALAVVLAIALRSWQRGRENGAGGFIRTSAVTLSLAALVATIWTGLPAVVLPPCAA